MSEQTRQHKQADQTAAVDEGAAHKSDKPDTDALKDEIDALLDDVDAILDENAAFRRSASKWLSDELMDEIDDLLVGQEFLAEGFRQEGGE